MKYINKFKKNKVQIQRAAHTSAVPAPPGGSEKIAFCMCLGPEFTGYRGQVQAKKCHSAMLKNACKTSNIITSANTRYGKQTAEGQHLAAALSLNKTPCKITRSPTRNLTHGRDSGHYTITTQPHLGLYLRLPTL